MMNVENKKPPKLMIRLAAALRHYVVDPSIAILLTDIKTAPMYMKRAFWSIILMQCGEG
jgi:hypothetical protein